MQSLCWEEVPKYVYRHEVRYRNEVSRRHTLGRVAEEGSGELAHVIHASKLLAIDAHKPTRTHILSNIKALYDTRTHQQMEQVEKRDVSTDLPSQPDRPMYVYL